jgi:thioredoxin reductase (NADPH)
MPSRTRSGVSGAQSPAYEFFDLESSDEHGRDARELAASAEALPLVIMPDGTRLTNPSVNDVARRSGLKTEATQTTYDVAIVGAGPAGLAAAVYAASEGLTTVLLDREAPGGQAGTSSRIENYLGFPDGVSGNDLARDALRQAHRFDVECSTRSTSRVSELTARSSTSRLARPAADLVTPRRARSPARRWC